MQAQGTGGVQGRWVQQAAGRPAERGWPRAPGVSGDGEAGVEGVRVQKYIPIYVYIGGGAVWELPTGRQ